VYQSVSEYGIEHAQVTHLNVHEEGPGGLNELLELVLLGLSLGGRVEKVDSESLKTRMKRN
jgi:hypothetical protein